MTDDRTPVLVGVGVVMQRLEDPEAAKEPIELMIEAVRAAGADARCPEVLTMIEQIAVPQGRWQYPDPARLIARAINARNSVSILAKIGILQQSLFGDACQRIADGELDVAAVVGGEAGYRMLRSQITGRPISYVEQDDTPDITLKPHDEMRNEIEGRTGLRGAVHYYAMIESAYRAAHGWSVDDHRDSLAEMYSKMSETATRNPHAWKRQLMKPSEIRDPSPRNPMLAFPYTKLHVSSWNVDQASAMIFTSVKRARELGIPEEKWIYPLVSSESNYMMDVSERPSVGWCPGAEIAGKAAMAHAGVTGADLKFTDFYTCFPVAVETYAEALGVSLDREMTVTGGMPFGGGPLNNYVLQATCRMAELLRETQGDTGLVTSVSGLLTKQGFGIWSRQAPSTPFKRLDVTREVAESVELKQVVGDHKGDGTIAAYTTLFEGGVAQRGVAIIDIDENSRTVAWSDDADVVDSFQGIEEFCGRRVSVNDDRFSFGS